MRKIVFLVVHCTATAKSATVSSNKKYWKENLGWKSVGYHIIIEPDGTINRLAEDSKITNGVKGFNSTSLHVSYIGGVDRDGKAQDTRTEEQKESLLKVLKEWKKMYPDAVIQGHRDFVNVSKKCPSFNAKKEYEAL